MFNLQKIMQERCFICCTSKQQIKNIVDFCVDKKLVSSFFVRQLELLYNQEQVFINIPTEFYVVNRGNHKHFPVYEYCDCLKEPHERVRVKIKTLGDLNE